MAGGTSNNSFTVSAWSGGGAISGSTGTDQIIVARNTDMTLTNTSLALVGLPTLTLSAVETATLTGGDSDNRLNASAFTLGPVTLQGGNGDAGDDILMGGTSTYSSNKAAIDAIMAEWKSTNAYAVRVSNLLNGGGLNGTYRLYSATVQNDSGAVDSLTGGSELDWFFESLGDSLKDLTTSIGELETTI